MIGAAIYVSNNGKFELDNCTIEDNVGYEAPIVFMIHASALTSYIKATIILQNEVNSNLTYFEEQLFLTGANAKASAQAVLITLDDKINSNLERDFQPMLKISGSKLIIEENTIATLQDYFILISLQSEVSI